MKNLTNILSYLWLLLLMAVTACSDLEEEVGPMQGDEEVELTIPVEIPGMKAATRTVPTENITQITAIAFDENGTYIKTRQAVLNRTMDNGNSTRGTLRIKVPSKTRSIHFLAKNNANEAFAGIQSLDNLKYNTQTLELHYWGFLSFASTAELKAFNRFLTLYRNQAMITLEAGESDYIAGFVNYNTSGTMVPYSNEHGFGFRIASQNGVVYQTIPNGVSKQTDGNNNLGKAHYLFEHENNKNNQPLYAVCKIGSKFYKVAFARTINSNLTYFPIIRNHEYKIVVDPTQINTAYGFDYYDDAKNSPSPINDVVITTVDLSLNPTTQDLIINVDGEKKCTVTVTVPQGITNLKVSAPKDANSVEVFTITPPDGVTINAEGEYIVNPNQQYTFTFTLADNYNTTGTATIEFSGSGSYYKTNKASATIYLKKNGQLTVNPTTATIDNTAGTKQDISVTIPQNTNINKLQISTDAFEVSSNNGLSLQNGYYNVSSNNTYSFTFTLKQGYDNRTDNQIITFTGTSDHWTATGTSTITLREPTEVREVPILAEPYTRSLNYTTNANSVSDLIVNVTIPKEVSTLTFDSEYFDAKVVGQSISLNNGGYAITHENNAESTTVTVRLRLKDDKKIDTNAGFTFDGTTTNGDVTVIPAVVSDIDLNPGDGNDDDEYVRWQGYAALEWGKNPVQIPFPYSWFEGLTPGSILRVEYEVNGGNNPTIQFTEVKTQNWTGNPYYFGELGDSQGVNLDNNTSPSITTTTTRDLILTSTILNKMNENLNSILGETNVALAIQGGGAILKKVSILPNNNYVENGYPVWSGSMQLNQNPYVNTYLPVGTGVTLYFGSNANGGTINVRDYNGTQLVNNASASNGSCDFTISNNAANGLNINGSNLTLSSVVLKFPVIDSRTEIFTRNFNENTNVDCWNNSVGGVISATSAAEVDGRKVLSITNTPGSNDDLSESSSQFAINGNFIPGNYTLTYKIKGSTDGIIQQGFQHFYTRDGNQYKDASKFKDVSFTTNWNDNVSVTLTIDKPCNRFLLNFGKYEGTIYIDDLRLVKN